MSGGVFGDAKLEARLCVDCNRRIVRVFRGVEGWVGTAIVDCAAWGAFFEGEFAIWRWSLASRADGVGRGQKVGYASLVGSTDNGSVMLSAMNAHTAGL